LRHSIDQSPIPVPIIIEDIESGLNCEKRMIN
jgi:hypothetical protein